MKKLWGGRFEEQSEAWIDTFGASISFDQKLATYDIAGSLAHVTMLAKTNILSPEEAAQITAGLEGLQRKLQAGTLAFSVENEDIHLNIEKQLHEKIGPVAGKLHTGRSRNDQIATDLHLYLKETVPAVIDKLHSLRQVIVFKAEANIETIMPGYTHLQHAQPISFAHHLMAYYSMLTRDQERFIESLKRIDCSPLGCAALAGTTFPIERTYTAELLGFSSLYENSIDGVSDRDFVLEFLSNSALLMMHLSRFCEEIILWCSHEFQFIELADTFATGSSIMPQKKKTDMAELVRSKTGRVYGNLVALLSVLKGLPLAYNKDLQEDKEGLFDSADTILASLTIMTGMVETMTVKKAAMAISTEKDFSNATELADYLANKGLPFRKAHEIVGKLVLACTKRGIYLQDISLEEYQTISSLIEADIYQALSAKTAITRRRSYGGTGFEQVTAAIKRSKIKLNDEKNW